jgi:hypothetical protein
VREYSLRLGVGEILGRIGSLQLLLKSTKGWCLEALKGGAVTLLQEGEISWKNTVFHFTKIVKGALDGWNSLRRICKFTRSIRSCREIGTLR